MIHRSKKLAAPRRKQRYEHARAIRIVRGDRDVNHLCAGEPQPWFILAFAAACVLGSV